MANSDTETEARERAGRDWVGGLIRAVLAIYLLPALLVALAVGGLLLAVQAAARLVRAIRPRRHGRPRSGQDGADPRCVHHASHLGQSSRQALGRSPRRAIQPRP